MTIICKEGAPYFHCAFSKIFDRVKSVALWSANIKKTAQYTWFECGVQLPYIAPLLIYLHVEFSPSQLYLNLFSCFLLGFLNYDMRIIHLIYNLWSRFV